MPLLWENFDLLLRQRTYFQPISEPARSRQAPIFGHGQGRDVTDAALVETAGRGVMRRMRAAPVIIWRERQDADRATGPVIRLAVGEKEP